MSSDFATDLGVLPLDGPVPYLPDDGRPLAERWAGPRPQRVSTWFHATWEPQLGQIAREGLIPSSWTGGDCSVVFGYDERPPVPSARGDVVLQIRSRALPGQLKALWVPWWCIVGAWHGETFVDAETLRAGQAARWGDLSVSTGPATPTTLRRRSLRPCLEDPHVHRQQELWRATLLNVRALSITVPARPPIKAA